MIKKDKNNFQFVDEDFFISGLQKIKKMLDKKVNRRDEVELYFAAQTFLQCLGANNDDIEVDLSLDETIPYIEKVLKECLNAFPLEEWIEMGFLCEQCFGIELEPETIKKQYTPEEIINSSFNLFEEVDPYFLKMAQKILKQRNFYIYLNDFDLNQLFTTRMLGCQILMTSKTGESKEYFTHELTHAVVEKYFPSLPTLLDEMPSMFFETLMYEKETGRIGFRTNRILNTIKGMKAAYNYSNVLTRFEIEGRHLDINNVCDVLGVKSWKEIEGFYSGCKVNVGINSLKYIMSFMHCIYLIDLYHEDKNYALCELREFLYDSKELLPNTTLLELYFKNVNKQSKTYVKK